MFDTIRDLLVNQFEAQPEEVSPGADLEDLLHDSLDLVEFSTALSERLNIHVTDDELGELSTIDELIRLTESKGATV